MGRSKTTHVVILVFYPQTETNCRLHSDTVDYCKVTIFNLIILLLYTSWLYCIFLVIPTEYHCTYARITLARSHIWLYVRIITIHG